MSTRSLLPFSHVALPSRIFASPGRMSYLSKSNWMSLRFGFAANSAAGGRAGAGVGVGVGVGAAGGVPAGGGCGVGAGVGGVAGVVDVAAPVGAGADAAVIAGRFAQPARTTTDSNKETMIPFRQRLAMIPPFR